MSHKTKMYSRRAHYGAIFGKWWLGVNTIWTLLSSADTLVAHYGSPDFEKQWDEVWIAPKWGWKIWGLGVAVITTIFAIEYTYRRSVVKDSEVRAIHNKLQEIENAKPEIKADEPNSIHIIPVNQGFDGGMTVTVPFLRVRFINDPSGPFPSANAIDVRAKIEYYQASRDKPFLSIDGRWAESDQKTARDHLLSLVPLLKTTFGFKETRNLDIAYRDARTGRFFAWNNEHYRSECLHHLLDGNDFRVRIELMGDLVHEEFSFHFKTDDTPEGFLVTSGITRLS